MLDGNLKSLLRELLRYARLNLRHQYAFPIKAKVLRVYTGANQYLCDVQPLRNNGQVWEVPLADGNTSRLSPIKRVEINTITTGASRGIFALPEVGTVVRISFWGGDRNYPYVDAVLNPRTPELEIGEVAIYRSAETYIRLRQSGEINVRAGSAQVDLGADGSVAVTADGSVTVTSDSQVVVNCSDVRLGGPGGQAVARIGDQVQVGSNTGTIIEGSSRVRSE